MNHKKEIDHLAYLVQPTHGMITSIAMAHLEFLDSVEGVAQAKMELFNHVPVSGKAFINGDDETLKTLEFPVNNVIRYGLSEDAHVRGRIVSCDTNACYRFELAGQEIQLQLPGKHNVYNALAAAAVGLEFQIPMTDIKSALQNFGAIEKRMQVYHLSIGIILLDDSYNANPTSCAAAFETLSDLHGPNEKKQYVVLGDMLELGSFSEPEHRKLGQLAAKMGFAGIFGFGDAMKAAVEEARYSGVPIARHFTVKADLLDSLIECLSSNDQVLVKGSRAMRMEDITEGLKRKLGNSTSV
jgi:UDP-N-acetylmuramoyl-tripeptide--D-alanyl-D-alanine ligase